MSKPKKANFFVKTLRNIDPASSTFTFETQAVFHPAGVVITVTVYVISPFDHLFGKELFIRFTSSAFRKLPSIYVFSYFPFGFEGRMWDLIVSVPDHCLSFYFS